MLVRLPPRCPALAAAAVVVASTGQARGEYVENQMGRDMAAITLATAGSLALGCDVASVVYLAGGPGDQAGRIIVGVGALVGATGLTIGSSMALAQVGEGHIPCCPPENEKSEEAAALTEARVVAGIDLGLAAVSLGLGIAAMATFEGEAEKPSGDGSSWTVVPLALGAAGGGLGVVGTF